MDVIARALRAEGLELVPLREAEIGVGEIGDGFSGGRNAAEAVADPDAAELAGLNLGEIERRVEVILLPVDEEEPGRAAVQARPFERGERAFSDMGTEFFARKARGSVRRDAAQGKPVFAHILSDGVDDAACDPVAAIEAGHETLVGGKRG